MLLYAVLRFLFSVCCENNAIPCQEKEGTSCFTFSAVNVNASMLMTHCLYILAGLCLLRFWHWNCPQYCSDCNKNTSSLPIFISTVLHNRDKLSDTIQHYRTSWPNIADSITHYTCTVISCNFSLMIFSPYLLLFVLNPCESCDVLHHWFMQISTTIDRKFATKVYWAWLWPA